jgi:lipopolysaccharide/colanic/teichoic acid biosynthesis glycosyltransferase
MTIAEMPKSRSVKPAGSSPREPLNVESQPGRGWFFRAKEALDRAWGLLLLVPALPVIGLLIVVIRLSSRGPGIYHQVRVGKGGKIFTMYKLRSMRSDAEAKSGPTWSASGADPRVTRLGFWLRRLHLDELPQLLNVVRGEMALVGPRPERPEFVKVLAEQIPGYRDRLAVLPGITGLAQINLPPDSDLDSVRRKQVVDLDYIQSAGFWLDARILFCTLLRMIWIKGPAVTRFFGLEKMVILPTAAPSKPTAAAVSLDTLVMKQDDTVTDFPPNSDKWQATRREDAAETGRHLQAATAAAHDA